eukprot:TRINITY_DN41268_c0_g1_i1.p1 TRINITY_DN41268_c0_g1~~TRINITY_DN41268_c0_g1_i1.p1  ORF type:complete len:654 (-),score=131.70 TRINITY_DN41268_c0_g1_i1:190-1911(-)
MALLARQAAPRYEDCGEANDVQEAGRASAEATRRRIRRDAREARQKEAQAAGADGASAAEAGSGTSQAGAMLLAMLRASGNAGRAPLPGAMAPGLASMAGLEAGFAAAGRDREWLLPMTGAQSVPLWSHSQDAASRIGFAPPGFPVEAGSRSTAGCEDAASRQQQRRRPKAVPAAVAAVPAPLRQGTSMAYAPNPLATSTPADTEDIDLLLRCCATAHLHSDAGAAVHEAAACKGEMASIGSRATSATSVAAQPASPPRVNPPTSATPAPVAEKKPLSAAEWLGLPPAQPAVSSTPAAQPARSTAASLPVTVDGGAALGMSASPGGSKPATALKAGRVGGGCDAAARSPMGVVSVAVSSDSESMAASTEAVPPGHVYTSSTIAAAAIAASSTKVGKAAGTQVAQDILEKVFKPWCKHRATQLFRFAHKRFASGEGRGGIVFQFQKISDVDKGLWKTEEPGWKYLSQRILGNLGIKTNHVLSAVQRYSPQQQCVVIALVKEAKFDRFYFLNAPKAHAGPNRGQPLASGEQLPEWYTPGPYPQLPPNEIWNGEWPPTANKKTEEDNSEVLSTRMQ